LQNRVAHRRAAEEEGASLGPARLLTALTRPFVLQEHLAASTLGDDDKAMGRLTPDDLQFLFS